MSGDNGHDDEITSLSVVGEELEGGSPGPVIDDMGLESSFKIPDGSDPLKMLYSPGTTQTLMMRGHHKDRRVVVACSHLIALDKQFGDEIGKEEILLVLAGSTAIGGERSKMLVDAYAGRMAARKPTSFMGGLKKGLFGDKDENDS